MRPVVLIPLSGERGRGMFAQVDEADAAKVAGYSWSLKTSDGGNCYAVAYVRGSGRRGRRRVLMHTLLTGWARVDHEDGNGLNCTRRNMRKSTASQNGANSSARRGSSAYKGVAWYRQTSRWQAYITVNRRRRHLGYFTDEADAARAYDAAAIAEWGAFARLNFPA
jgi:hypothetical protein